MLALDGFFPNLKDATDSTMDNTYMCWSLSKQHACKYLLPKNTDPKFSPDDNSKEFIINFVRESHSYELLIILQQSS